MSTTQIEVLSNHNTSTVVLRWTKTLPKHSDRELYDVLEGIAGVENVHLRRYSAELTYAVHVTTADKLIETIRELLDERDGPVAALFGGPVEVV